MDFVENATSKKLKLLQQLTPRPPADDIVDNVGVLAEDHPLLEKFQQSLKAHLLRVKAQLQEEISEIDHSLKTKNDEYEEIGANLYDLQQKMNSQNSLLDEYSSEIKEISEKRMNHEKNIAILKKEYDEKNYNFKQRKQSYNEILMDVDNMQILENNISKWAQEIKDEVSLAKRVVSKDSQEKSIIADEKRKMDLFLLNLDSEVRRRDHELTLINNQIQNQDGALTVLQTSLTDANTDLEALQNEHKRLHQTWGEVIVAIQQRDSVLTNVKSDLDNEYQKQKVIKSNIENTKKAANKEMEQNEKLESYKNRLVGEIDVLEKQLENEKQDYEKLTIKIENLDKILEQTERDLTAANQEGNYVQNQLKSLNTKLEKQGNNKMELEEKILELLQDQITTDKASEFRAKLLRQSQVKRRDLEINMSSTENQLSDVFLDLEKWKGVVNRLREETQNLETDHFEANNKANKLTDEINGIQTSLNVKMRTMDSLNKQLNQMISQTGGHEVNPEELRIGVLERNIMELEHQIKETQNFWLRLQGHVVNMSEKRSSQMDDIYIARRQLLVIDQKTLKIESTIEQINSDNQETVRTLSQLNTKLDFLSGKLFEKKKNHETEEVGCSLNHQELTDRLKEAEMSTLSFQQELVDLTRELEDTKNLVQEKHREALSWETKFKMTVEAKKYRDEELSQESEIGCMRAEIHRMEVRFLQLRRAQEKLVQDLENCIQHREHIFDTASVKEKIQGTKSKSHSTVQHRLNEIKNKLRQINGETVITEKSIAEITNHMDILQTELQQRKMDIEDEKLQDTLLQSEVEQGMLLKQENLENIVRKQHRAKRYKVLAVSTNPPKCKSESSITHDMEKQREVHEHLVNVVERLLTDFASHKFSISRILQTLKEE